MSDASNRPKRPGDAALYWISLLLTLAVTLPLLGCLVLYTDWQEDSRARAAQRSQSGVTIAGPGPEQDQTFLIAVAREKPGFVLLRLNAPEAKIQISALPGECVLRSPTGPVLLEESYRAAGPGRAADLIGETLEIPIDRYLALTPESITAIWAALPPPRIDLSSLLSAQELGGLGLKDDPVISLRVGDAEAFISQLSPGPARRARLQGAVWDAALRQQLTELPTAVGQGLRRESGRLLGSVTAQDYFNIEKTLSMLARRQVEVEAEPVPGRYDRRTGRYELDTESLAFAKERFSKGPMLPARPSEAALPEE